jgi:hypothetical protein
VAEWEGESFGDYPGTDDRTGYEYRYFSGPYGTDPYSSIVTTSTVKEEGGYSDVLLPAGGTKRFASGKAEGKSSVTRINDTHTIVIDDYDGQTHETTDPSAIYLWSETDTHTTRTNKSEKGFTLVYGPLGEVRTDWDQYEYVDLFREEDQYGYGNYVGTENEFNVSGNRTITVETINKIPREGHPTGRTTGRVHGSHKADPEHMIQYSRYWNEGHPYVPGEHEVPDGNGSFNYTYTIENPIPPGAEPRKPLVRNGPASGAGTTEIDPDLAQFFA